MLSQKYTIKEEVNTKEKDLLKVINILKNLV